MTDTATQRMPVTDHQVARLREQIAFLTRNDGRYRRVMTDSASADGIALVCESPRHPANDQLTQLGMYDCCDPLVIHAYDPVFAAFIVSALIAIPALLDERDLETGRTEHAVNLVAALTDPACDTDKYGNCATHGVLVLEAGAQCPHVLARAFLAGAGKAGA